MAKKPVSKKVAKAAKPPSRKAPGPVSKPDAAPTEKPVLYVKAGVTTGWRDLWVWDVRAKTYVRDVLEANVVEGWYDQAIRDAAGELVRRSMGVAFRRVRRVIEIRRRPQKKP